MPLAHSVSQDHFYAQSEKRDVPTSVRRFALGFQPRGLHLRMREATSPEEHLFFAQQLEHPHCSCVNALEPDWLYVFSQLRASFTEKGVPNTLVHLVDYRYQVMQWMTTLKHQLRSLQREINMHITTHAVHVQTVLLYILLVQVSL